MYKLPGLSLLLMVCLPVTGFGQSKIALQHNGVASFFGDIPATLTAAVDGDTLYLPGGSFPAFTLNKKLAIIGVGDNPDSTAATIMTLITGSISLTSGSTGSILTGLLIYGAVQNISSEEVDSMQISRCLVTQGIVGYTQNDSNWTITECYLSLVVYLSNSFISNNIFQSYINNVSNCQIENNIFLSVNTVPIQGSGTNCIVKNNIFNYFLNSNNVSNSLFYNNIWSSGSLPNAAFGSGNIGVNNINDPDFDGLFQNFSYATYNQNLLKLYPFDFHLVNPVYNIGGTNGTPIGIYGGTFPWKAGSIPFNPHISLKVIAPTTNSSGNLPVQIRVAAQDH